MRATGAIRGSENTGEHPTVLTSTYLETFPRWVDRLGDDVHALSALLANKRRATQCNAVLVGALNYLFVAIGLIPDGIEDIGYLDDAFVLRVAARRALAERPDAPDDASLATVARLARECALIEHFLRDDFLRLETYVDQLRFDVIRDRSAHAILDDDDVRHSFLYELRSFAEAYEAPRVAWTEESLRRIRALLDVTLSG